MFVKKHANECNLGFIGIITIITKNNSMSTNDITS